MAKLPITRTPAYLAFIHFLKSHYIGCGAPRYTQIIELVLKLDDFYPPKNDEFRIDVKISPAWLSLLLTGKLDPLPTAEKFRAVILALGCYAVEVGIVDDEPDRSNLREWQELLRQTKKKAEQQARDGVFVDDDVTDAEPSGPSQAGHSVPELRGPQHLVRAEPVSLLPIELKYLMEHGPYAQTLTVRADKGDAVAHWEAGVLFGCDGRFRDKAVALFKSALAAGLELAWELLEASRTGSLVPAAVAQARALADHHRDQGEDRAHATFRSCATQASVRDGIDQGPPSS